MDPMTRLEFAVDFVQENLKSLRPGDLLNRKNDLKNFCASNILRKENPDSFFCAPESDPEKISDADLSMLQEKWRFILFAKPKYNKSLSRAFSTGNLSHLKGTFPAWGDNSIIESGAAALSVSLIPCSHGQKSAIMVIGSLIDVATFQLIQAINRMGSSLITACADPVCPMYFVRTRRQRFCSRQCAVKNAVSRYRKRRGLKSEVKIEVKLSKKSREIKRKPNTKRKNK